MALTDQIGAAFQRVGQEIKAVRSEVALKASTGLDLVATYTTGDFNALDLSKPGLYRIRGGTGYVTNMPSTTVQWWHVVVFYPQSAADANTTLMMATSALSNTAYYRAKYGSTWGSWVSWTTYSAMSVAEGTAGIATTSRVVRADYLKQIVNSYITGDPAKVATALGQALATAADAAEARADIGAVATDDPRLSDARTPTTHTHLSTQITDPENIARNVQGYRYWHDLLAYGAHVPFATQEKRISGTWTEEPVSKNLFDTREYNATAVLPPPGDATDAVRWTWNSNNLVYSYGRWFYLVPTYTTGRRLSVTVERSNDGVTWETVVTGFEFTDTITPVFVDLGTNWSNHSWARLTIEMVPDSGTGGLNLSSVQLLSNRKGSQGSGFERALPFDWDVDRKITVQSLRVVKGTTGTTPAAGEVNLGTVDGYSYHHWTPPASQKTGLPVMEPNQEGYGVVTDGKINPMGMAPGKPVTRSTRKS